ncbi:hypothetical protein BC941DRAFT_464202 [Chlamydoabsidia padenii]|nr:hypothetical protein BC941DRAFT_464202 [Chlamydoabsidia padenii]
MLRGKRKQKKQTEPIPTTIDGFGYVIKENGAVRSKTTDSQYVFEYQPKDFAYNEARYNVFIGLLGDVIEEKLQQAPYGFQKVTVPLEADPAKDEPHTYFYMTPNALTTKDKLVVFIPGTQTRVGQWCKRVLCDESIYAGSMLDMAKDMIDRGYEVIILNPNGIMWYDNASHEMPPLKFEPWTVIPGNESPEEHCQYVFRHFVRQSQAEKIGVVALGYGGHCFAELLNDHFDIIKPKVVGVAIANTSHLSDNIHGSDKRAWMYDHVVNWTVSDQPKGENVPNNLIGCSSVSAGPDADLPDYILWKSADDMVKFIGIKMGEITLDEEDDLDEEQEQDIPVELVTTSLAEPLSDPDRLD